MRKYAWTLFVVGALATTGCNQAELKKALADAKSAEAQKDSLLTEVLETTQFVTDINGELAKAKSLAVTTTSTDPGLPGARKDREDRKAALERVNAVIAKLNESEAKLTETETRAKSSRQRNARLLAQIETYKKTIDDLRTTAEAQKADFESQLAAANTQIEQLKEYAKRTPDGELVAANQEVLKAGAASTTWSAGPGNFSVSSFYAWAIGGGVPFLGEAPLAFLFGGSGKSWGAWATGTAVIGGSFVLDPNAICLSNDFHTENSPIGVVRKGTCNFTASGGGAGISEVNISFYSNGGTYWGTLSGTGALVGGLSVEGQLELTWQGWH